MPEQFQTSFIPKKAVEGPKPTRQAGADVFLLIAVIIFGVTVLAAAGVFLYEKFLVGAIVRKEESLARAQEAFEPDLIRELSRLDQKLSVSQDILAEHVAVSELFRLLEESTLTSVRFEDLKYSVMPGEGVTLAMQGAARSFAAIALQSDVFGKSRFIKNPIFSNLDLDEAGNVTFDFTATIDPSLLLYERVASQPDVQVPEPEPPATDQ